MGMGSEIKFKCWDSENKKMYYQTDEAYIQLYLDNKFTMFDGEDNVIVSNVINSDNMFMQYIGWDDKNGNNIFYGDIVKYIARWDYDENEMGTALIHRFTNNGAGFLRVIADVEPFWINNRLFYSTYASWNGILENIWYDEDTFDMEVVGNIFETPDLINQ